MKIRLSNLGKRAGIRIAAALICCSILGFILVFSVFIAPIAESWAESGQKRGPLGGTAMRTGGSAHSVINGGSLITGQAASASVKAAVNSQSRSVSLSAASSQDKSISGNQPEQQRAEPLYVDYRKGLLPQIGFVPNSFFDDNGRTYVFDQYGNRIYFTIDPWLQQAATQLLTQYRVPYGAIVAIEPKTGKILAIAGHSSRMPEAGSGIPFRATYPAASLFKIITGAAAVEATGMRESDQIVFRGGNYTLGEQNYRPDSRKDRRTMSVGEAMGKSVNPVFGRIALTKLSAQRMAQYAAAFGFNAPIQLEVPLEPSRYSHPVDDYELSRTGAGFGEVDISPLHAAMVAGALADNGVMMRPYLIEQIAKADGRVIYSPRPSELRRVVKAETADEVIKMMTHTITDGTAKRHFTKLERSSLRGITVAAKTGTLKGDNPPGLYRWFVAAAPANNPRVAIAALVVDMGGARIHGTGLGRRMLDYYFMEDRMLNLPVPAVVEEIRAPKKKKSAVSRKRTSPAKSRSKSRKSQ